MTEEQPPNAAILVAIARLDEKHTALAQATQHSIANVKQEMVGLARSKDVEANTKRLDALESNQLWVVRSLIGAVVGGAGGIFAYLKA